MEFVQHLHLERRLLLMVFLLDSHVDVVAGTCPPNRGLAPWFPRLHCHDGRWVKNYEEARLELPARCQPLTFYLHCGTWVPCLEKAMMSRGRPQTFCLANYWSRPGLAGFGLPCSLAWGTFIGD